MMTEKSYIDFLISTDFDDDKFFDEHYSEIRISYFDHIMSEEEYVNAEFTAYSDFIKNPDKLGLFISIELQFVTFYKKLYEFADKKVCLYNDDGHIVPILYEEFNNHIINAMKERPLCTIVFPSLQLFTWTGWDLTHSFYVLKKECKQKNDMKIIITAMANSVGLHVI